MKNKPFKSSVKDWDEIRRFSCNKNPGMFYVEKTILELRDRVAALEARLPWTGTAADVAPQVVPITTPVEPAPQAQEGVTVEELARILSEAPSDSPPPYWLLEHPRLGPLLRGEGAHAPVRVVLPEEPRYPNSLVSGNAYYLYGYLDAWAAARAEVERQQGGQADD
jgi:hypothetical protein